jgi:hypothetical protein
MVQGVVQDEEQYPYPEDTLFPCTLESVRERVTVFQYKDSHTAVREGRAKAGESGEIAKWVWVFKVTAGDYTGSVIYGETQPKVTSVVRQWAEALRGAPYEIGEQFDSDLLLGLPCALTVRHMPVRPKRDGSNFYPYEVESVFPADAVDAF